MPTHCALDTCFITVGIIVIVIVVVITIVDTILDCSVQKRSWPAEAPAGFGQQVAAD